MYQASRKDFDDEEEIQQGDSRDSRDSRERGGGGGGGQAQEEFGGGFPQQIAPKGIFDPSNFFADYNTGNENIQAFWKVPCVAGSSRVKCWWIPITCMQFNQGTYTSWLDTLLDGFTQISNRRTVVVKKNLDRSTPLLQRFIRAGTCLMKSTIVFIRKVPFIAQEDPVPGFGNDGFDNDGFDNNNNNDDEGEDGLQGGRRRRFRRRCNDRNCYGRCDRCRRNRGGNNGDEISEWESRFPFRQAALMFNFYCSKLSAATVVAGGQCRSKPTGCSTSCSSFPSPINPGTWTGGPGVVGVGHEWEAIGSGPNFPNLVQYHGFGPLAQEQYQLMWSSAEIEVELRNPFSGCRYYKEKQIIPV